MNDAMRKVMSLATRINPAPCPFCGKVLDSVNACDEKGRLIAHTPSPGDWTICYGCGSINRFDDRMQQRGATDEEIADLPHEERVGFTNMRRILGMRNARSLSEKDAEEKEPPCSCGGIETPYGTAHRGTCAIMQWHDLQIITNIKLERARLIGELAAARERERALSEVLLAIANVSDADCEEGDGASYIRDLARTAIKRLAAPNSVAEQGEAE